MGERVACPCNRGTYDPDQYQACFMCSTEGKEDCPACGKKRAVDPTRFICCYTCNQQGKLPKCAVCTQEDTTGFWQDLNDGRKVVVCEDCMANANGDVDLLHLPQPTLMDVKRVPPKEPQATPSRPPPNLKIGTQNFGHHVEIEPGQVAAMPNPYERAAEVLNQKSEERAPTPLYPIGGKYEVGEKRRAEEGSRGHVNLKCPVCGFDSQCFSDANAPLCFACNISLNAEPYCMCCGDLFSKVFVQGRYSERYCMLTDQHTEIELVESYVTVCGSCLWGYHGTNCDPPAKNMNNTRHLDVFPQTACPLDGNIITDGRPVCSKCAARRFQSIKYHNSNWDTPEQRGKGIKYLA